MSKGVELIAIERKKQIEELKWDYKDDVLYADEQLALAGACYALPLSYKDDFEEMRSEEHQSLLEAIWPWDEKYWKPTPMNRIKELAKAGALIAAQIDYELNKKQ